MAENVGELAARRAGEPEFFIGTKGAPAKRAKPQQSKASKPKTAAKARASADQHMDGMVPADRKIYTNFSIRERHREALENYAWERKRRKLTTQYDLSSVLRLLIDYWIDNPKEVGAWIARQQKTQGNR